jgi:hypothetical protein
VRIIGASDTVSGSRRQVPYANSSDISPQSVSAIYACFLAMILFPEVALKAQTEIDAVVGSERLPTFEDRPHLPYINAVVKEVLRWNSVTPLGESAHIWISDDGLKASVTDNGGGPHRCTEDDVHEGYFIPTGSIILTNIWYVNSPHPHQQEKWLTMGRKMSHNDIIYADPMTFNPDRFLGSNPEPDPMDMVFGFGRYVKSSPLTFTEPTIKLLTTGEAVPEYILPTRRYTSAVPCL